MFSRTRRWRHEADAHKEPGAGRSQRAARAVTRGTRYEPTPDGQQLPAAEPVPVFLTACVAARERQTDFFPIRFIDGRVWHTVG